MCRTLGIKPLHHVYFELISVAESKPVVLGFWAKQQKETNFLNCTNYSCLAWSPLPLQTPHLLEQPQLPAEQSCSTLVVQHIYSAVSREAGETPSRLKTLDKFGEQLIKGQVTARVQLISGRGRKTLYPSWQN